MHPINAEYIRQLEEQIQKQAATLEQALATIEQMREANAELLNALKQLSYEVEYMGGKLKPEFNEIIAKHGGKER